MFWIAPGPLKEDDKSSQDVFLTADPFERRSTVENIDNLRDWSSESYYRYRKRDESQVSRKGQGRASRKRHQISLENPETGFINSDKAVISDIGRREENGQWDC